jgi:GntR family transcriptional regulator
MIMGQLTKTYKRSRVPLYLQVASTLARRIEGGQWQPGQKISTLEELGVEFQVARVTVRQAIEVLQNDGLVRCRQGKGTFVTQGARNKRWLKLETEWSALVSTIEDNVPRFINSKKEIPSPRIDPGEGRLAEAYEHLLSVQSRAGVPYAVASVHLARSVFDWASEAFQSQVALSVLARLDGVGIVRARQSLVIGGADPDTATHLKIALGAPTAEARCVVTDGDGVVIYVGEIVYRGDCVKLDGDLLASLTHD